jgi:hypothetical protein
VCHLGGRSPGECQQHDAPRIGAALDQMSDPMGERGGLARSGAGNDEKRPRFEAEPAAMFDGTTLLWIEVFQARPLPSATGPTGFSDRAAARGGRGLESVRTELGLNHDSPFVRNVVMCDVARPGRFVINHERKSATDYYLSRCYTAGFPQRAAGDASEILHQANQRLIARHRAPPVRRRCLPLLSSVRHGRAPASPAGRLARRLASSRSVGAARFNEAAARKPGRIQPGGMMYASK